MPKNKLMLSHLLKQVQWRQPWRYRDVPVRTPPECITSPGRAASPTHELHFCLLSLRLTDCSFQEPPVTPVCGFSPARNTSYVNASALCPIDNVIGFLTNTWVLEHKHGSEETACPKGGIKCLSTCTPLVGELLPQPCKHRQHRSACTRHYS